MSYTGITLAPTCAIDGLADIEGAETGGTNFCEETSQAIVPVDEPMRPRLLKRSYGGKVLGASFALGMKVESDAKR